MLKEFVQFFKKNARGTDSMIRYGGEEFVFLMPQTNKHHAEQIIDRLRKEFSRIQFDGGNESFSITFSSGLVK